MARSPIRIELFGGLRVALPGQPLVEVSRQQSGALLALLALRPERNYHRDELLVILWPDDDGEDGRRKLRQSTYALRKQLSGDSGDDPFISTRDTLQINPAAVTTDVQEFENALAQARAATDVAEGIRCLERACEVYSGELLPGLYHDEFLAEQTRLAAMHRSALRDRMRAYEQTGRLDDAIDAGRRLVTLDPLTEEAHTDLMQLYALAGQPSEVIRQYRELADKLETELGVKPADSTQALAARLRSGVQIDSPSRLPSLPPTCPSPARPLPTLGTSPSRRAAVLRLSGICGVVVVAVALWIGGHVPVKSSPKKPPSALPGYMSPYLDARLLDHWPFSGKTGDKNLEPVAIAGDDRGYIYFGGFASTPDHDVDILVTKVDPRGRSMGEYRFNGEGNDVDRLKALVVGQDGTAYFTGESLGRSGAGPDGLKEMDIVTVKLAPDGLASAWQAIYDGPAHGYDSSVDIALSADGSVYVAGRSWDGKGTGHAIVVVKYGPKDGKPVWTYQHPRGGQDERAVNLAVTSSGIYVAAHSSPENGPPETQNLLIKLDPASGHQLWQEPLPGFGPASDSTPRVTVDANGWVYFAYEQAVAGAGKGQIPSRMMLRKYSADRTLQWETDMRSKPGYSPTDLKVDPRGGVVIGALDRYDGLLVVTGVAEDSTRRYQRRIAADPGHSPHRLTVSVDADGNVAATGCAYNGIEAERGTVYDVATFFVQADNQWAWRATYDGPDHSDDHGLAVWNRAGKVYVAIQTTRGGVPEIEILNYSPIGRPHTSP